MVGGLLWFSAWPGPPVINPPGRNLGTPNLVVQPFFDGWDVKVNETSLLKWFVRWR